MLGWRRKWGRRKFRWWNEIRHLGHILRGVVSDNVISIFWSLFFLIFYIVSQPSTCFYFLTSFYLNLQIIFSFLQSFLFIYINRLQINISLSSFILFVSRSNKWNSTLEWVGRGHHLWHLSLLHFLNPVSFGGVGSGVPLQTGKNILVCCDGWGYGRVCCVVITGTVK